MPLIYITGPTGSGKSTVCEALQRKGFESYDTDDEGMRTMQNIDGKKLFSLDKSVLRKFNNSTNNHTIFICGTSPTDLESADLFSIIILLYIDETEQIKRVSNRTKSAYGKKPHQLNNAKKWREAQLKKYRDAGAVEISSNQDLETITSQILKISGQE